MQDLCAIFGYYAEEHIVQTGDGYLLGLHRLSQRKGEDSRLRVNAGKGSLSKPIVYLHHGLLMNSEVWVAITDEDRCLPFALVEQGYDVWVSQWLKPALPPLTHNLSWGTIEATNTRRNPPDVHPLQTSFGTFVRNPAIDLLCC